MFARENKPFTWKASMFSLLRVRLASVSYIDVIAYVKQDAQLSQRDRAAGCVIVFTKSRKLELGDNILQTLGL